jgi:hypothetical protein
MMKKYRLYRMIGNIEYKDVEAESMEQARKRKADADGFIAVDSGYILNYFVDNDLSNKKQKRTWFLNYPTY